MYYFRRERLDHCSKKIIRLEKLLANFFLIGKYPSYKIKNSGQIKTKILKLTDLELYFLIYYASLWSLAYAPIY